MSAYEIEILAFAPHPDDVEICCGGIMAKMSRLGYRTGIIDMTRGELGSRGSAEIRATEVAAASKVLGLHLRENLELPDGGIDPYSLPQSSKNFDSQLHKVVACLRRLRPELVLLPYPSGRHPDHGAASTLLSRAIFFARNATFNCGTQDKPLHPRQIVYYQERFSFTPSFVVDISEVADKKLEAIKCYKTQLGLDNPTNKSNPTTLISSPLSLQALEARDRYYGAMIASTHGEPFLTRNAIRLDDPLSHIRLFQKDMPAPMEGLFYPEEA